MDVPAARGLTWYEVLTMASIVEQEARFDTEKAKIAGVLQNRLDPSTEAAGFLGSDPTVFYVNDTLRLSKLPLARVADYVFWTTPQTGLPTKLPASVAAYNTYSTPGLPPGPISTPTLTSIDAALTPDTKGELPASSSPSPTGPRCSRRRSPNTEKNIAKYMK